MSSQVSMATSPALPSPPRDSRIPFGQDRVEPSLTVSEAWQWNKVVRARAKVWPRLLIHSFIHPLFQEGLGTVGLKGDRVCKELSHGDI